MKHLLYSLALLLTFGSLSVHGSIVTNGDLQSLSGATSGSFMTSESVGGVTFDLTYMFSTNIGVFNDNGRLGINSTGSGLVPEDTNASNDRTSINLGEVLTLTVAASNIVAPAGQTLTALDFGIPSLELVRSGGANGTATWEWDSSALAAPSQTVTGTATGSIPGPADGGSTFDLLGGTYTATLTVVAEGANNTSGIRIVTSNDVAGGNLDSTITPTLVASIPEPSAAILLGFATFGIASRRRRRLA